MKIRAPRIYVDTHVRHPEIEIGGNKTPNDKKKIEPTVTVLNVNFSKVHYGNLVDLPKVTKIEPEEIDEVGPQR